MIYLEIAWGRCYAKCQFSLMKNGFRWCEKVLHGGDVTQNDEKSIQRLSLNGKAPSLFRSKLICFLHKVFLRKLYRRIVFRSQDRDAFADSPFNR